MLVCICSSSSFFVHRNAVLIMAGSQALSALLWCLVFAGDTATLWLGRVIRIAFIVVPLLLTAIVNADRVLLFCGAYAMIFVGPVLGFSYFFITLSEIAFYNRLYKAGI